MKGIIRYKYWYERYKYKRYCNYSQRRVLRLRVLSLIRVLDPFHWGETRIMPEWMDFDYDDDDDYKQ